MLRLMRKHAKNWGMKFLLGIIIVVFVFYFGSLRERDQANLIATLDGKALPYADFQQEYQNLIDLYRKNYGSSLDDETLKKLGLQEQAANNLIDRAVLSAKADELKLPVSDKELQDAILSYPGFQNNGRFDQRIYEQTLRLNNMTAENFEAQQKTALKISKLQTLLSSGAHVSDGEIFDMFRMQNEKINLGFVKLSSDSYRASIKPTRQDLEDFLKEKGSELRTPEMIQLKYLSFLASDYFSSINITGEEIKEYYDRNKGSLTKRNGQPPPLSAVSELIAANLRQIAGMRRAAEEAKTAHDTIYQQENFDAYAKAKGLKIKTSDFFPADSIPREFGALPDFSRTVLSLGKNEITKVLSDEKGYHVFQLAAKKPSRVPTLAEAKNEIEGKYTATKAGLLCEKEAQALLERLKKGESWEAAIRAKGLKAGETGFFLPGADVPNLGLSGALTDALMQLSETKPYPDKAVDVNGSFVIVRFKERGKVDEKNFLAHKEEIKSLLTEMKKRELLGAWVEGAKKEMIKEGRLVIKKDFKD